MRKLTGYAGLAGIILLGSTPMAISQMSSGPPVVRPRVSVEFENEVITLAKGFEYAFRKLPAGGKYILVSSPSGQEYLKGSVDSVEAIEGVLLIRLEKGLIHVISARDIVRITNERPSFEER